MSSEFKTVSEGISKAVAAALLAAGIVAPVRVGWSMVGMLQMDDLEPGKLEVFVTPGPTEVQRESRRFGERSISSQITPVLKLASPQSWSDPAADVVVFVRETLENSIFSDQSRGSLYWPVGDYTFDGFETAAASAQPIVEQTLVERQIAATFVTPSYSAG